MTGQHRGAKGLWARSEGQDGSVPAQGAAPECPAPVAGALAWTHSRAVSSCAVRSKAAMKIAPVRQHTHSRSHRTDPREAGQTSAFGKLMGTVSPPLPSLSKLPVFASLVGECSNLRWQAPAFL